MFFFNYNFIKFNSYLKRIRELITIYAYKNAVINSTPLLKYQHYVFNVIDNNLDANKFKNPNKYFITI
jgi:hypothetical protein